MQKMWVEFHGVEVGDVVKVVAHPKKNQGGWNTCPPANHIGEEFSITQITRTSIHAVCYCLPFFCLEFVRKAKQVDITITMNGEKVDPKSISKETWENLRK